MKNVNIRGLIITAFLISWLGVTPSILLSYGINIPEYLKPLDLLMTFGTIIAAVIYVYKADGFSGVKKLFAKLLKFKAPIIVIVVMLSTPFLSMYLGSILGFKLADVPWPEKYTNSTIIQNAIPIFIMYLIVNTEEFAWRGVVFDKLLSKYGFIKATFILFPIWWLFHIPYFFFAEGHPAGYGIGVFTLMVFSLCVIIGWIYMKSDGSLFYSHVSHQLNNGIAEALPIFPVFIGGSLLPIYTSSSILFIISSLILLNIYLNNRNHID